MEGHKWMPITDLPDDWASLSDPQLRSIVETWIEREAEERDTQHYKQFLERLRREWAIETGVIERLYTLSEGATRTLIEHGLDAALVSHDDMGQSPAHVLDQIRDQYQAIEGLYQVVSSERPLSKSFLLELHQVFTAHQTTYQARDTLGNYVERELPRGRWKLLPNNVELDDGGLFEFCPPEHVESEIDRLLAYHRQHEEKGVFPDVEAAWLHHRFSLIHPFTDGNGRMARAIATLVLIRGRWMPLVVLRTDRPAYIGALRSADRGDLRPLVELFGELQKRSIRKALSLQEQYSTLSAGVSGALNELAQQLEQRRRERVTQLRGVLHVADELHAACVLRLETLKNDLQLLFQRESYECTVTLNHAPSADKQRAGYYRYQVVQCAKQLGYFANRDEYHAWAVVVMKNESKAEILVSFHAVGGTFAGIMAAAAMLSVSELDAESGRFQAREIIPLAGEPFEFSYRDSATDLRDKFQVWLEDAIASGINQWRSRI